MKKIYSRLQTISAYVAIRYYTVGGALIGCLLFFMIYGYASLKPTNVAFIYDAGDPDLLSHQLGFDFFRRSPWQIPPGVNTFYPYPYSSNIIFSDSLPIFSLLFKLISPLLPDLFQFFGIWTLLCFLLQGSLAALLLRKFHVPLLPALFATPLFICNVPLLFRCFHHSALAGQWLILLGFLGFLYHAQLKQRQRLIFWTLLTGGSVLVMGYLFLMVGFILAVTLLYDTLLHRRIADNLLVLLTAAVFSIFCYYLGGGFHTDASLVSLGLGVFSLNLLAPINPARFSSLLPGLPLVELNSEQSSYWGLGVLLLFLLCLILSVSHRHQLYLVLRRNRLLSLILSMAALMMFLLALSPVITCGTTIVFNYFSILPAPVLLLLSSFRATARFFYPVWYLILLLAVVFFCRVPSRRFRLWIPLLLLCLSVLQYIDVVKTSAKNGAASIVDGYPEPFCETFDNVFSQQALHMSYITNYTDGMVAPAVFAAQHHMSFNASIVGRGPKNSIATDIELWNTEALRSDTIYVIPENYLYYVEPVMLPENYEIIFCDYYYCVFDRSLRSSDPIGDYSFYTREEFYDILVLVDEYFGDTPIITVPPTFSQTR